MYRATVLTILALLLLAVAGASVAREGRIFPVAGPNGGDPRVSAEPERASPGAARPWGTTGGAPPGSPSRPEDPQGTSEPAPVTEPALGEAEEPPAATPGGETPAPGPDGVVPKPGSGGSGVGDVGKPAHAGKAPDAGEPRGAIGQRGNGGRGSEGARGRRPGRAKATVCHKGAKTLAVGAPALAAHLRHGDTRGGCRGGVPGPEPPGATTEPEAAKSSGGGGSSAQNKVVLCHKGKITLAVGAGARAAHLRHGDSLGACR
jgi:hypothetical protein